MFARKYTFLQVQNAGWLMNIRNAPRSQNGMLHSVRFTELRVKNNSRQRMNFPSENSTIISALARSAQTYEALPVSMIRRAGLIQKLRILRSFSCNVKCDSVVCAADVGRQHSCLLRSFSCSAIFQFFAHYCVALRTIRCSRTRVRSAPFALLRLVLHEKSCA